jgi:hypothetical protein
VKLEVEILLGGKLCESEGGMTVARWDGWSDGRNRNGFLGAREGKILGDGWCGLGT